MSTSASTAAAKEAGFWTLRALLLRHKLVAVGVAAVIAVMLSMILVPVFGSKAGAVSDSTTCSQWGSANQAQQAAYVKLYTKEHGPLRGAETSPADIIAAINNGCTKAYGDDVSDTVTVTQAVSGNF